MLLNVISQPDARDWTSLPFDPRDYTVGISDGIRGLRVAFSPTLGYVKDVHPEVAAAVRESAEALGELGAHVEEVDPGFECPLEIMMKLWFVGSATLFNAMTPAQQALADNTGLVPTPIIGELIKFVDSERYLINALGTEPMFTGTASRPRVTQATLIGAQATEFTELSTRKMLITKDALTRGTYGGYVEISEQDQEFTDPSVLQIVIEDLAQQYGLITDTAVCTALVAAATNTFEMSGAAGAVSANTSPTSWNSALFGAAGQVYTQSRKLPTHFFCSVDVWVALGGLVDTAGRPIYPSLNPQNSNGMVDGVTNFQASPAGLKFVCDPNFAANTAIVGAVSRQTANVYEMIKGTATGAFKPGTLATEVGYRGFLGTYFRAEGFVRLVNAV